MDGSVAMTVNGVDESTKRGNDAMGWWISWE